MPELLTTAEADAYLQSIQPNANANTKEQYTIKQNEEIIKLADDTIIERLKYTDSSLRITDIVSAKESAFRQNQKIL